jgi:hypothetical protein
MTISEGINSMHCILLQDWTTLTGASGGPTVVTQTPDGWFDAAKHQDMVAWIQVSKGSASTGLLGLNLATSPTRDIAFLSGLGGVDATVTAVTVKKQLNAPTYLPIARWIFWSIAVGSSMANWDVTFRIFLAVNSPGGN